MSKLLAWWHDTPVYRYYEAQSQRDQWILLGVAALLLLALYLVLLWRPARDYAADATARQERASELVALVRAQGGGPATGDNRQGNAQSLLGVVGDAARAQQLVLSRVQPDTGGASVTVVMDDEALDKVLRFVDVLEREHGLSMRQVTIDRKAPGRASVRLVVR